MIPSAALCATLAARARAPGADAGRAGKHAGGYVHHRVYRQQRHPRPSGGWSRRGGTVSEGGRVQRHYRGPRFSTKLAELGVAVTVCVATRPGGRGTGRKAGITVHSGRLQPVPWRTFAGAALCVDATHPYAVEATRNIRAAAAQAGVEYRRLLRAASPLPPGCVVFDSAAQAAEYLAATEGNILLATGAKELRCLPGWIPPAFTRGSCPPWRALPRARARASRTATSLPCRGRLVWR